MIKLAYFGSPDFSAYFLEKILIDKELKKILEVSFVITQPDRPVGRKQILTPTPVKQIANQYNIKVVSDFVLRASGLLKNLNLALVYSFSAIIPKDLLNLPKYGFWCIHPSLLPRFRGPSPIVYPLILGEEKTGVTIFQMDEKIDHGSIIAQKSLTIKNDDYRPDLEKKITDLAFNLYKQTMIKIWNTYETIVLYKYPTKPQNHSHATYTRLLKKDDGFIPLFVLKKVLNNQPLNFDDLPLLVKEYLNKYPKEKEKFIKKFFKNGRMFHVSCFMFHLFRGLSPWPGLWTILPNGKRLKICDLKIEENKKSNVLRSTFYVPRSTLHLTRVQLEGKKPVDFDTFNRAYKLF